MGYVLALHFEMGARGIWIGNLVSSYVLAAMVCVIFFRGKWKQKKI